MPNRLKLLAVHSLEEGYADFNDEVIELTDENQWVARKIYVSDGFYIVFHWHWRMKGVPNNVRRWMVNPACHGIICCYGAGLPQDVFEHTVLNKHHDGRFCETAVSMTERTLRVYCLPDTEVEPERVECAAPWNTPFMRKHLPTVMKLHDWWVTRDA